MPTSRIVQVVASPLSECQQCAVRSTQDRRNAIRMVPFRSASENRDRFGIRSEGRSKETAGKPECQAKKNSLSASV